MSNRTDEFRLLLDSAGEGIYTINNDGNCTFCNAKGIKLLGYDAEEELLGKNMHWLIHHSHEDHSKYEQQECKIFKAFIKNEGSRVDDEVFWRKDGTCFPVEYSSFPMQINEVIIGAVINFFDITERKRLQEQLLQAKKDAEEANKMKSHFLSKMSHEIRTPMGGVLGYIDLLRTTKMTAEQSQFVQKIKMASDMLMFVIDEILDFSKLEAGKMSVESAPFNLVETMESCVSLFLPKSSEKGLLLEIEIEKELPTWIIGDSIKIRQILNNSISNGIKFTKEGRIQLKVYTTERDASKALFHFEIKDSGIGISESELSTLFEPFVQANSSTSREYGGSGLGLSICSELVRLMGGSVSVKSVMNEGTVFHYGIPMELCDEIPEIKTPQEYGGMDLSERNIKILVADDNELNRLILKEILKKIHLGCDMVSNGADAVKAAEETGYDVIFMDCHMPIMDGYEASRRIRSSDKIVEPPFIIAVTANAIEGEEENCLKAGMNYYITKPLEFQKIYEILSGILRSEKIDSHLSMNLFGNLDEAVTESGLSREALEELIRLFSKSLTEALLELENHIKREDFTSIKRWAHNYKGTSGNLRIHRVFNIMSELEDGARNQELGKCRLVLNELRKILE